MRYKAKLRRMRDVLQGKIGVGHWETPLQKISFEIVRSGRCHGLKYERLANFYFNGSRLGHKRCNAVTHNHLININ